MNRLPIIIVAIVVSACVANRVQGQTTSFNYQGELKDGDCLAEGTYSMTFTLWDSFEGGSQLGGALSFGSVPVSQGVFSVDLNWGISPFTGTGSRWLEIAVEGTVLAPRQRLSATPYSIRTRGIYVDNSSNVGIGVVEPEARLDVAGDAIVRSRLGVGHPSAYYGQISVVDSGVGAPFAIAADWNNDTYPTIFASNVGSGGVLLAQGSSDVTPADGGLIVAGSEGGENLAIDANEIMARDNGQASTLYLNYEGGTVVVGGTLDVGYQRLVECFEDEFGHGTLFCPEGMVPLGGGCESSVGIDEVETSKPFCGPNGCGWFCRMNNSEGACVHVICARLQ